MTLKQLLGPGSALFLEEVCTGSLQPMGLFLCPPGQFKKDGRESATALSEHGREKKVPHRWCEDGAEVLRLPFGWEGAIL